MPKPYAQETLYDAIGEMGGGANLGTDPLLLPANTMAGAINTTVRGKNVTHRPPYYNRIINAAGTPGFAAVFGAGTPVFQGMTEEVCLDDTGNAYVIALISARVFSFKITATAVTCTELTIYAGAQTAGANLTPIAGGYGTATSASISSAKITGATISMSGTYTGTITGTAVTSATLNGGTITAGTVTGGSIISTAGVVTPITTGTISAGSTGFVVSGTITAFTPKVASGSLAVSAGVLTPQAWLWQSELWVIIQDGTNNPIVVNLNTQTAVRSNFGGKISYPTTTSGSTVAIAPIGSTFTITFSSASNLVVGDYVWITNGGQFLVTNISGTTITLQSITNGNGSIPSGTLVQWSHISTIMPPGRMGAYGQGRNWMALIPPNQFIALDLVGGAAGTTNYEFRDAVLNSTENNFIVGGGTFCVPSTKGPITAMKFMAQIDDSQGQGPLVVFTHKTAYFCQAPVDRLTWQNLTNPILPQAKLSYGAKGQWSTIPANSDMVFRSVDGIRSMTLDRQSESGTWGDVPCSFEVSPVLALDNLSLLNFGSAVVFNNRLLHTVGPVSGSNGTYWTGLVTINFDPLSTIRGKEPSVWDSGTWVGSGSTSQMQILQLSIGEVSGTERAFALTVNTTASPSTIEFWEILQDGAATADNDGTNNISIPWQFDSASLRFEVPPKERVYMQLNNGELWFDNIVGTLTVRAQYRPDQYPGWTDWAAWQTEQTSDAANSQPAFVPRQGLGEPSAIPVDYSTDRPMRNFFTLQTRLVFVGHAEFLGAYFEAKSLPMPKFAPLITTPLT